MLQFIAPVRADDGYGSGVFGASRGGRLHEGVDYACYPGSQLLSPVAGRVSKLGYTYASDLSFRYVEITDGNLSRHRFMYVEPMVEHGALVVVGGVLGTAQAIADKHNLIKKLTLATAKKLDKSDLFKVQNPMAGHVHYEIIDDAGNHLDPENQPPAVNL